MFCLEDFFVYVLKYFFYGISKYLVYKVAEGTVRRCLMIHEIHEAEIDFTLILHMTGGGTAGHVTPNIALMPALQEAGYEITYIGSYNGMEKELIEAQKIPYIGISSGKLRRYFDWKNFSDPFKVLKGYGQAISILRKLKPDVVFSKGGFVSVPVVLAAKHCHIPAIIHESDITPGLANKIAIRGAKKVCCNFPETMKYLPAEKAVLTGSPIPPGTIPPGDAEKFLN